MVAEVVQPEVVDASLFAGSFEGIVNSSDARQPLPDEFIISRPSLSA